jgi:hypothetical protein
MLGSDGRLGSVTTGNATPGKLGSFKVGGLHEISIPMSGNASVGRLGSDGSVMLGSAALGNDGNDGIGNWQLLMRSSPISI